MGFAVVGCSQRWVYLVACLGLCTFMACGPSNAPTDDQFLARPWVQ